MAKIILASGSPRRRDMLAEAGLDFEVIPSPADEIHDQAMPLHRLCEANAELKARAVADEHPSAMVIGADTLVYIDQTPLGKPKTEQEAREMLARLSGRAHKVCTGVCIAHGETTETFHALTEVVFKNLTPKLIQEYMDKVNVMDKAGSYAVQEHGEMIIDEVRGSYENVVGLPVAELCRRLALMNDGPRRSAPFSPGGRNPLHPTPDAP